MAEYELYYWKERQSHGRMCCAGERMLREHLKDVGVFGRCMGPSDLLVQGWLANPKTYPEELRREGLKVFLWKPEGPVEGAHPNFRRPVAYLHWKYERVYIDRNYCDGAILGPALLVPAA